MQGGKPVRAHVKGVGSSHKLTKVIRAVSQALHGPKAVH